MRALRLDAVLYPQLSLEAITKWTFFKPYFIPIIHFTAVLRFLPETAERQLQNLLNDGLYREIYAYVVNSVY